MIERADSKHGNSAEWPGASMGQSPALDALPLSEQAQWTETLSSIASQPLEYSPELPIIASRFEAWWQQAVVDRPIFIGAANLSPERALGRRIELLNSLDEWFDTKLKDMQQLEPIGDGLPSLRIDFGAVVMASLVGSERRTGADTSWYEPFIDDEWSNAPDWTVNDNEPDWKLLQTLVQHVADQAKGKYLVCTPDIWGPADILLNLRGSEQLCFDTVLQPESIRQALDALYPSWHKVLSELYRGSVGQGAGLVHWLGIWSNEPYAIPACDFNALIGPDHFESIFLPEIQRQAQTVHRAVFHLDGPGAANHIDALLEIPEIQAIQFTPGVQNTSALKWVDMFKKIQSKGRSLAIFCPADEILELSSELKPEGLAVMLEGALPKEKVTTLFSEFNRQYGSA